MNPKVSIIIPIYNVEKFLSRTMKSILDQTLHEIEIIMVDDESPDNCPALCNFYAQKYPNIKVIHKKNEGLGMACNSGIEIATGDYIAFCDSDDYVDKEMYETMYTTAIKYNADAVFTGIKTVNQIGKVSPMNTYPSLQIIKQKNKIQQFTMNMIASEASNPIEREVAMSAKIVLYRKSMIEKYNIRFISERVLISEDLIWNIDILCHSNCIVILPYTGYYYYNNTSSLSKRIRTDRFPFFKVLRKELLKKMEFYQMPEETKTRIDRMFIGYCRFYIGNICKSQLPKKERKNIINEICNDNIWNTIWHTYPIKKMPKKHCLLLFLMRCNCFSLINLIYKII